MFQMHPIHYSLILNLAVLLITGFLSYVFEEPLLVVVALLLANHSMARFQNDDPDDEDNQPMGFLADVK